MSDKFDVDASLLDRLVDGELEPTQRRHLLASLDDIEDGWRRCALAFLEAQAWRRELALVVNEVPAAVNCTNEPWSNRRRSALGWLALAASLAVAFLLGTQVSINPTDSTPVVADNEPVTAKEQKAPSPPSPQELAGGPSNAARDSIDAANALRLWVRSAQGDAQPLNVPLVDATTLDRELGLEFCSGISDELRQQLADQGYRVESRQSYAPLWLDQGRPLVVPVEDTRIVPIQWQVY